ncbi:MAG: hypothetical protein V4576_01085 [Patescibacteria group bacterium]
MNKILPTLFIVIVVALGYLAYKDYTSIKGCYVATIDKDVYTLQVVTQKGKQVDGILSFKNAGMDSSSGTFAGTYSDKILFAEYAFEAEGTKSVVNVIFKKDGDAFIRGTGEGAMTSLDQVVYDASAPRSLFKKVECGK